MRRRRITPCAVGLRSSVPGGAGGRTAWQRRVEPQVAGPAPSPDDNGGAEMAFNALGDTDARLSGAPVFACTGAVQAKATSRVFSSKEAIKCKVSCSFGSPE